MNILFYGKNGSVKILYSSDDHPPANHCIAPCIAVTGTFVTVPAGPEHPADTKQKITNRITTAGFTINRFLSLIRE